MLLIWRKRGRDEPATIYASYVSEPPSALSPGLAGALIDEKVDTKEIIATIVDLARRGYLEITDTEKKGVLGKSSTIFTRTQGVRRPRAATKPRWPTRSSTASTPTR